MHPEVLLSIVVRGTSSPLQFYGIVFGQLALGHGGRTALLEKSSRWFMMCAFSADNRGHKRGSCRNVAPVVLADSPAQADGAKSKHKLPASPHLLEPSAYSFTRPTRRRCIH
jgi:hypothetical protein